MDELVLGGERFSSRFILGSGKFSLPLVSACISETYRWLLWLYVG